MGVQYVLYVDEISPTLSLSLQHEADLETNGHGSIIAHNYIHVANCSGHHLDYYHRVHSTITQR